MTDPPDDGFIRIADVKKQYLGGRMSVRWWYRQVEVGTLPHFRAGGAVLLRPADVEAFVAALFCDRKEAEPVAVPADLPPATKARSDRRGLRFFGN